MRAVNTSQLLELLCPGKTVEPGLATLRVLAAHSDDGAPLPGLPVWLRWNDPAQKEPIDLTAERSIFTVDGQLQVEAGVKFLGLEARTDADGGAVFCGVPAYRSLDLFLLMRSDDPEVSRGTRARRLTRFYLMPNEVISRTVKVSPEKP